MAMAVRVSDRVEFHGQAGTPIIIEHKFDGGVSRTEEYFIVYADGFATYPVDEGSAVLGERFTFPTWAAALAKADWIAERYFV